MELANKSDDEILKIANPIMDNLMEGSKEIDHEKHTRDFTDRMKGIVTKDYLKKVCKRYQAEWGHFAKREFVAVFRRPSSVAIIWKQWCTKQEGEFVAELVLVERDSRYLVDHAMVF
jgi:hypothetical protein